MKNFNLPKIKEADEKSSKALIIDFQIAVLRTIQNSGYFSHQSLVLIVNLWKPSAFSWLFIYGIQIMWYEIAVLISPSVYLLWNSPLKPHDRRDIAASMPIITKENMRSK